MADRPLIIIPASATAMPREKKARVIVSNFHFPTQERQRERLDSKFTAQLQQDTTSLIPERVIVLEVIGSIENFINAVQRMPGLEWLDEWEREDIPPDDDFFTKDQKGNPRENLMQGRMFLIFSNLQGREELLNLWQKWKNNEPLDRSQSIWKQLFYQLHDIRYWGVQERFDETGILEDWRDRINNNEENVCCEVELWWRQGEKAREGAERHIIDIIRKHNGRINGRVVLAEIKYHAILVELPIRAVENLFEESEIYIELIQCEYIQFFRASGQMATIMSRENGIEVEDFSPETNISLPAPVVALFDGMPLQNHKYLAGRLKIDDPDDFGADYLPRYRSHGTTMSSLIIRGDIDADEKAIDRLLYVRPIMRPDLSYQPSDREMVPNNHLIVDLIHRAVKRMFEGDNGETATAPQVCAINLSIGIKDRLFYNTMSPLARLLDWLSWKYKVLFIVSAGNHNEPLDILVSYNNIPNISEMKLEEHVIQSLAANTRHRRLLSPAESMNALTIGATHKDVGKNREISRNLILPYLTEGLPSIVNAQGMGYRRSIKPDILMAGGRIAVSAERDSKDPLHSSTLKINSQLQPPGQKVAIPGSAGSVQNTGYTFGTSNATALATRTVDQLYTVLENLKGELNGDLIDMVPRALWIKTLLTHSARWGDAGQILTKILKNPKNSRQFKEYLTRLLGYGEVNPETVYECTRERVTVLSGGELQVDETCTHNFPLPPSLSGKSGLRKLTITLAWFTPINPVHRAWRQAHLWFDCKKEMLKTTRKEANWQSVRRGTLQHEIFEGKQAAAYVENDHMEIQISCRQSAGNLQDKVPYALAATLEIDPKINIDIYNEIRTRVSADARIQIPINRD